MPPWVASIHQGVLRDSLAVPFATPRRSRHTHEPRSFALTLRCCFGLSANELTHEVRLGQTHPPQVGCVPPPIRWLFGTVLHHKTVLHIARYFPRKDGSVDTACFVTPRASLVVVDSPLDNRQLVFSPSRACRLPTPSPPTPQPLVKRHPRRHGQHQQTETEARPQWLAR